MSNLPHFWRHKPRRENLRDQGIAGGAARNRPGPLGNLDGRTRTTETGICYGGPHLLMVGG